MGIVVTFAMLLALLVLLPQIKQRIKPEYGVFAGRFLLLAGLWNALWFGLRHLPIFWGQAALVSGLVMVLAAILILKDYKDALLFSQKIASSIYNLLSPLRVVIIFVLLMSFLLYAVTLIRLNLGMSILN